MDYAWSGSSFLLDKTSAANFEFLHIIPNFVFVASILESGSVRAPLDEELILKV